MLVERTDRKNQPESTAAYSRSPHKSFIGLGAGLVRVCGNGTYRTDMTCQEENNPDLG